MLLSAATRHGYILAILIPSYASHGVYFFLPYEEKSGINIVDGKRRKLRRVMRERHRRAFRKQTFKIRPRWYLTLLFVTRILCRTA